MKSNQSKSKKEHKRKPAARLLTENGWRIKYNSATATMKYAMQTSLWTPSLFFSLSFFESLMHYES